MNLNEYIDENLTEGIKYFKNSVKLKKLVAQIEYDVLTKVSNDDQRKELKDYINNVKDAIADFESIENEFSRGNKRKARLLYKEAKQKYKYLLTRVDKPLAGIFRQYGSSLLYFATIQAFTFLIAPQLRNVFTAGPTV